MKKIFIAVLILSNFIGYSQEDSSVNFPKNELKINALFLLIGAVDVSYERLLNSESGAGVSCFIRTSDEVFNTKYAVTGFYRRYFGYYDTKPAEGFYAEGFGALNGQSLISNYNWETLTTTTTTQTDFALGLGIGSKWISKSGVIFELNLQVGRNLFNKNTYYSDFYGKLGATIGYRF